jgi:hypothetical protein
LFTTGMLDSITVVIGSPATGSLSLISVVVVLVLFLCDPNAGKTVRERGELTFAISSFNAFRDSVGPNVKNLTSGALSQF